MSITARNSETLPEEFEALFTQHYRLLYRTAYSVTGNRNDAEDVLQSLFVRLLEQGLSPALERNPAQYLYRAVVNLSLNVVRTRKRQKLVHGVEDLAIPVTTSHERNTLSQADEIHEQLIEALAQLKPRWLEILLLHYKHNYTDAQIATLLGTSRGTVAVTLYRIRAKLRKLLRTAG